MKVRYWEPGRYWVSSRTRRSLEHLVDFSVNRPAGACSCEDYQFRHAGHNRRDNTIMSRCCHIVMALPYLVRDMLRNHKISMPHKTFDSILRSRHHEILMTFDPECEKGGCLFEIRSQTPGDERYCLAYSEQPLRPDGMIGVEIMAIDSGIDEEVAKATVCFACRGRTRCLMLGCRIENCGVYRGYGLARHNKQPYEDK